MIRHRGTIFQLRGSTFMLTIYDQTTRTTHFKMGVSQWRKPRSPPNTCMKLFLTNMSVLCVFLKICMVYFENLHVFFEHLRIFSTPPKKISGNTTAPIRKSWLRQWCKWRVLGIVIYYSNLLLLL